MLRAFIVLMAVGFGLVACDRSGAESEAGVQWEPIAREAISTRLIEVHDGSGRGEGIRVEEATFQDAGQAMSFLEGRADLLAGVVYLESDKRESERAFLGRLVALARKKRFPLYVKPAMGKKEAPEKVLRLKLD